MLNFSMNADSRKASSHFSTGLVSLEASEAAELRGYVSAMAKRDEVALSRLYTRTAPRLMHLALRITRSSSLAEEALEACFWQAWNESARYDEKRGSVMTWLYIIIRSRALDVLKREGKLQTISAEDLLGEERDEESYSDPLAILEQTQGDQELHNALSALAPKPRQLLAMAFFHGMTHDELSRHTGMPLGTVKSMIRRSLLQLREALSEKPVSIANSSKETS
jgi:RNA polymerase sigma factor (sigma-70 family)